MKARTAGAPIMVPGLPDGRHWELAPYHAPTASYPHQGSALVYWDSGNATPPRNEPATGWQGAHSC